MQIIMNADDFGRSAGINAAVIRAHREGVLTSASLMVAGAAADEAVALARETPGLAVGLHLVVAGGKAVLPPAAVPHLVDAEGCFLGSPLHAGLRYFLDRTAREELAREMTAQFERFAATGLPLSHVDCHLHMQIHPTVFALLVPLAERYGARGLRLPRDDFWLAAGYSRRGIARKTAWAAIFGLLARWCAQRLRGCRLVVPGRVYGLFQSGSMREDYVLQVLRHLRVPAAELYFHPDTDPGTEILGPNPGDLAALLSPAVRRAIEARDLHPATYATLKEV